MEYKTTDVDFIRKYIKTTAPAIRGDALEMYSGENYFGDVIDPQKFSIAFRKFIALVLQRSACLSGSGDITKANEQRVLEIASDVNLAVQHLAFIILSGSVRIQQVLAQKCFSQIHFTKLNQHISLTSNKKDELPVSDAIGERIGNLVFHANSNLDGDQEHYISGENEISLRFADSSSDKNVQVTFMADGSISGAVRNKLASGQQRIRQLFAHHADPNDVIRIFVNDQEIKSDF